MKKALLALLILVCFSTVLLANEARLEALGEPSPYLWDYHDFFYNPAVLHMYSDFVFVEFMDMGGNNQFGGVTYSPLENLTVGVAVNRKFGEIYSMIGRSDISDFLPNPVNGVDIIGAYSTGTIAFGLGIFKSGSKDFSEVTDSDGEVTSTSEVSAGVLGVNLGTTMMMGETEIDARLNLRFNSYSRETETSSGVETYENTGGMGITFGGRAFLPMTSKMKLIPAIWFNSHSSGEKLTSDIRDDTETGDYKNMTLGAGVGANYQLEKTLIIAGASVVIDKYTDEREEDFTETTTYTYLPALNLALEHTIWKTLVGRVGVSKYMGTYKDLWESNENDSASETKLSLPIAGDESNIVSLGLGVSFGNFTLDWNLSTALIFNNLYLISGTASGFSSNVTATYNFD
ncbi:hypothetical protein JW877_00005 [bacterium]|nr:hypothetical protein [bacterium]